MRLWHRYLRHSYLRDNAVLTWMHLRPIVEFVLRLPVFLVRRWRRAG